MKYDLKIKKYICMNNLVKICIKSFDMSFTKS